MRKNMKTLRNFGLATILALGAGCGEEKDSQAYPLLPKVDKNQALILHPDYLQGIVSLGYTLLTDMDYDGSWDVAEKYRAGFAPGDCFRKLYFKQGSGPAQSTDLPVELVDADFFKPYQ